MLQRTFIFLFVFAIVLSCGIQKENKLNDIEIVNDIFPQLIVDAHDYQSYEDFMKEYDAKKSDSINSGALSKDYYKERKIVNHGKILLPDYFMDLESNDLDVLENMNLSNEYALEEKSKLEFEIDKITNRGDYDLLKSSSSSLKVGSGISRVGFSRIYFNKTKDKAILFFEIFCGELCYERNLVFISKDDITGQWTVVDVDTLEVA
ncbi:hypothetical protein MACH07_22010 [Flagellimonas marinaquae]|uniref:Lipoprotein n=1 Tax=Flagellimonas marinaquae TaxID=254955 RepID=A0AA48HAL8_9FLAO|nr:hypothetical protein MACH07_22010 [Allomuricauda aquimarina]